MTLEEQKAAELAAAEAQAKAEAEEKAKAERANETDEEREAREAKEQKARSQTDYEAELKREKERTEKAKQAAADLAFKLREKNRQQDDDDEEDKPLTAKELEFILQKDRQQTHKEFQSEIIAEKAKKLASNEDEAKLVIEIHKNRTFPEGMSLDEQLEEAFAIANRKRLIAQNEELKRSLRGRENISDNVAGTHRDSLPTDEPKMSSADISAIKAAGFNWDGKSGLYVKKISKERTLTFNPKTKVRKVI